MKVVVVQEAIIQPDLSAEELSAHWEKLATIPDVDLEIKYPEGYPQTEDLHEYIADADAVLGIWINDKVINEDFFNKHPNLKYIATLGHGWQTFNVEMTRKRGLTITNTVYGSQTIAEYAWALLMETCHHTSIYSDKMKNTDWSSEEAQQNYGTIYTPQIELYGKTCGIIGLGSIGFAFAKMAHGFGMNVISYSRHKKKGPEYNFIDQVDFDTLLSKSDVISIHAPLTSSTADMIDKDAVSKMKNGVILINTARGGLIVEEALIDGLNSGKIYCAGLDVLREEPPTKDNPLFHSNKTIITPHIAWLTRESRIRACEMAIDTFKAYLEGHPVSVIN
jgi:glycerate dehydrogenase